MKNSKFIQTEHIKGVLIILDRTKPKSCSLCECELSTPHQCKRCKRMICEKCGPHKAIIYDSDKPSKQAHRICSVCKDEKDSIKRFIEFQHIQFNRDSISIEWLNIYQTDLQTCIQNYEKAKQNAQKKGVQQQFDISKLNFEIVFTEIQQLINYSLKDFFIQAASSVPIQQQKGLVIGILDTFLKIHPEIGYSPDLVLITYFLLCFSSEPTTYILLTIIYGYIVPPHLYNANVSQQKYTYENEVEIVMGIIQESLKPNQQDGILIKSFIQNRIYKYIATLGINFFLVETQIYIFNQLFSAQRNFNSFLRCLAAAIECNNTEIKSNSINYDYSELSILRNLKIAQLNFQHQFNKKIKVEKYAQEIPQLGPGINTKQLTFNSLVCDEQQADQIEFLKLLQKTKHQEQIIDQKELIIQNLQEQNKVQDMGKLLQKVQELEFQVQQQFNEKSQLQEQLKNQQTNNATQSKAIQKELSTLQQHNTNCEQSILKLEQSIQILSTENQNLTTKLKQLNDNSDQKLQMVNDRLIEDNLKLENDLIHMKKQQADQKESQTQLQIQLQVLQLQIQEKSSIIIQNDEQIQGLNKNINDLKFELENYKLKNITQIKPQNNELNDQISRLQTQLQLAEEEIISLKDLKAFSESQRIELEDQLDEQNQELHSLRQLDNQQEFKSDMEAEIQQLKSELQKVSQQLQARKQDLEEALIKVTLFDQLTIELQEANLLSKSKVQEIECLQEEFRQKDLINSQERKTEIDEFKQLIQNSEINNQSLKQELDQLQESHQQLIQDSEIQKKSNNNVNRELQEQLLMREEYALNHQQLQQAQEQLTADYLNLQSQYENLTSECLVVKEKQAEQEILIQNLKQCLLKSEASENKLQEQNQILNEAVESLKNQIELLKAEITAHLVNINDASSQNLQLQLTISALETQSADEIKLREEIQSQIEQLDQKNNAILQEFQDEKTQTIQLNEQIEKIKSEFEKQGLLVNELNAQKYQLQGKVSEQQKVIEQEVEKQREISLAFEQNIAQLEEKRLQQDLALNQSKQEFSDKTQEYEEQIGLLQLADERNHRKLEQQSQGVEQLAELQIVKQTLDKQIWKYQNEIEQLKSQLDSNKESADTGSMEYQNSITQQLQAKNEEISLLSELNTELAMKSEEQENRIKDLELQVNNQQKALKEQNKQLEDQQFTQDQLLGQLNEIPSIKSELFQFSDSSTIMTKAKDQEDTKNVLEIKSFQNQILKGLLKDNQQQIQQLTQTLLSFKNILTCSQRVFVSN